MWNLPTATRRRAGHPSLMLPPSRHPMRQTKPVQEPLQRSTWLAYRMTRYEVDGVTFRIGHRSAGIDRILSCHGVGVGTFISAFNPFSQPKPLGWNRRMQGHLASAGRRLPILEGQGTLRQWSEAHLLLLGDVRPAIRLARRFRQNAVVIVRRRQPARLLRIIR